MRRRYVCYCGCSLPETNTIGSQKEHKLTLFMQGIHVDVISVSVGERMVD